MEQSSQCHYGQGNAFGHGYVGENPNTSAYNYGYQNVDNNGNGIHGQQRASVPSNHPLGDHPQADFQHASQPQVPNAHSRSAFNHGQQLLHVRRSGYTTKPEDLYTDLDPFVNSDLALNQTTNGKNSHLPGTATANGYYQTEETDEPVDLSNDSGEEREERSDDQDHVMTEDEDGFVGEAYGVPNEPIDEQDDDCQVASAPHNSSHDQSEHAPACKRAPRPTTPKPTRSGRTPADFLAGPVYARKDKDLRTGLQNQHRFHVRAKGFRPDVPLAEHRYWIGVLKTDKRPKTANEKSFIWMRGNRSITIRTIYDTFAKQTWQEDFVLLHGHDRVDPKSRCEELDYFDDRCIVLRALKVGDPGWAGKNWCDDIVPPAVEVVELDD